MKPFETLNKLENLESALHAAQKRFVMFERFFFAACIALFFLGFILGKQFNPKQNKLELYTESDTTLSGMRYTIFKEPRTGDLVVVNQTIDSLKVQMYKSQIK